MPTERDTTVEVKHFNDYTEEGDITAGLRLLEAERGQCDNWTGSYHYGVMYYLTGNSVVSHNRFMGTITLRTFTSDEALAVEFFKAREVEYLRWASRTYDNELLSERDTPTTVVQLYKILVRYFDWDVDNPSRQVMVCTVNSYAATYEGAALLGINQGTRFS